MSYPKWKYHKTEEPQLVESEEQEKELGGEWKESPADFESSAEEVKETKLKGKK